MARTRRRARRIADVDYDRTADAPVRGDRGHDGERIVQLDEDTGDEDTLTGLEFYERERPPHHG